MRETRSLPVTDSVMATGSMATPEKLAAPADLAATEIVIRPAVVAWWMAALVACVTAASIAGQVVKFGLGYDHALGLVPFTYVDYEGNLPTFYSSTALLVCALVTALIAVHKRQRRDAYRWHWLFLAVGLVYLALDEFAEVHEMIGRAVPGMWTRIAIPAVLVWTVAHLGFLRSLPRRTQVRLILGGAVFLAGAIGMEIVGNHHRLAFGTENVTYVAMATIEELLEMAGVVIALHALLDYAQRTIGVMRVRLHGGRTAP